MKNPASAGFFFGYQLPPWRADYTLRMEPPDRAAVIDIGEPSGDDSLIRWMLTLSPAERLQVLQGFVDSVSELRREQPPAIQRRP